MKDDTISRAAALDALGEEPLVWYDGEDEIAELDQWRRDVAAIKALPSAQPEIIRCKDCKHWEYDAIFRDGWCRGKHQGNPEWFCADGERSE